MKSLILDMISFLKTLTVVDYILYFSILVLIILIVSLVYLLKTTNIEIEEESIEDDNFDINSAVKELENTKPLKIDLTDYEKEQEEKAIISYEELVSSIKKNEINYETNDMVDDKISVKKINLDDMIKKEEIKPKVTIMSFEHEEAFLKALKQLQKKMN